jgi:hypothetical protein
LEEELGREPNVVVFRNEIKTDPLGKWVGLYFGKEAWRDRFSIGLSSWASGNACGFYFGIVKQKEQEGRVLPGLGTRLDSEFGRGARATPDWDCGASKTKICRAMLVLRCKRRDRRFGVLSPRLLSSQSGNGSNAVN